MSTTNNVPVRRSNQINKSLVAAVIGWSLIAGAVLLSTGFYAGFQYHSNQEASKKAAVQDALKAAQAPQVAEASPKN